jgi:hypothetical protein
MEVQRPGALHAPTGADASSIFHSVNFDRLNKMMIEPASMARQRACGGQISNNSADDSGDGPDANDAD